MGNEKKNNYMITYFVLFNVTFTYFVRVCPLTLTYLKHTKKFKI